MAPATWSLKARDRRILGRGALPALCVSLAFLHLYVVLSPSVSDAADRPASPAQLQGLRDQIAGLQGQLAAKEAELQAQNSKIADIKVKMLGLGALQDLNVGGPSTLGENLGMGGGRAALQFQLIAAESQRDAVAQQISSLQQQIEQLQATLNYWKDPLAADLENERARLKNLENQKPMTDDDKQLQREIDSERQRIKELEQQYQQSQPGSQTTTSGQSVQPQGSYATPSSGFGASSGSTQPTGQQGQQPGYGPGLDTGSPQVPYGPILEGIQGSIGDKAGGKPKPGG